MTPPADACIQFATTGGTTIIRLFGDIRYTLSAAFSDFLEGLFQDDAITDIIVDLTRASAIDSTNLGLLAKIAIHCRQHLHHPSIIVSDNHDINEVLRSVSFDQVFKLVSAYELPDTELQALQSEAADRERLAKVLLDAHKTLMGLSKENQAKFRDVVSVLEASGKCR
jgi:anti-anti-sigma factor